MGEKGIVDIERINIAIEKCHAGYKSRIAELESERDALKAENARILEVVAEAQVMLESIGGWPSPHVVSCKLAEAFVRKGGGVMKAEIKIHLIAEDGLPNMDELTGRVAFIWDGDIYSGWPIDEAYSLEDGSTWEVSEGPFLPKSGVHAWVEFANDFMDIEMNALGEVDRIIASNRKEIK